MNDNSIEAWLRPGAMLLALASILLVLVNAGFVLRNQANQREVAQRQQIINQTPQLQRVSQLLVDTVAKVAVANNDSALTGVLERHGFKITVNQAPAVKQP